MMNARLSAAMVVWHARISRNAADKAYVFYAGVFLSGIIAVPVVRALWLAAISTSGMNELASPDAPIRVSLIAATLCVGGLMLGQKRGPALLPPFLLHALTHSSISRSMALRGPVFRATMFVVGVLTLSAFFVGMVFLQNGQASVWAMLAFIMAAVSLGIVASVMWLVGQVVPGIASWVALGVFACTMLSLALPQLLPYLPWGWVGANYPLSGPTIIALVCLVALAAALVSMISALLNRFTDVQLRAQAENWERAIAFSFSLDFRAAADSYEVGPRLGRNIRAVRASRHRWVTFFIRDAIGQVRTPVRFVVAITGVAIAGVVMTLSFVQDSTSWLLAGISGIGVYLASRPLTSGLRYAANVAGDYPLYGVRDRELVLLHLIFPATALFFVLPVVVVAALVVNVSVLLAFVSSLAMFVLALFLHLSSALKGSLPPILVTPINTPVGDMSIVVQLLWVFSDALIALIGAFAIMLFPTTPIPLALVSIGVGLLIMSRWKMRR